MKCGAATHSAVFVQVETIGDCYVAVAGLPNPQERHAVIMARFASDCLNKVTESTHSLADSLGPDTANLKLRVGLHSGSVTGGVLRGQKSRFQLFGDSINTASRMESCGKPGYIHCSQTTADALVAAGKEQWLTPREDIVVAKGKGKLLLSLAFSVALMRHISSECIFILDALFFFSFFF